MKYQNVRNTLDDKSLDRMIKSTVEVLCNVHYGVLKVKGCGMLLFEDQTKHIPLKVKYPWDQLGFLGARMQSKYVYLVDLELSLIKEHWHRFQPFYIKERDKKYFFIKYNNVFIWVRDNVPDLPGKRSKF